MSNLFPKLFCSFPTVLVAEVAAVVFLTLGHVKRRLLWVFTSYLLLLSAAMAFGLIQPDEFGYSYLPAVYIAWPWVELFEKSVHFPWSIVVCTVLGAVINCVILYFVERVIDSLASGRRLFLPPNPQEFITKP